MLISEDDYLAHYGTPRHSGRYPWGSGDNEPTTTPRNPTFHSEVNTMKKNGMSEKEIADSFNMTLKQLRDEKTISRNSEKQSNITMAQRLQDKGMSTNAIAKRMGHPEPTVRSWLKPGAADKANLLTNTTNMLREQVDAKRFIDVGAGVEYQLNVSSTMLGTSITKLQKEGYKLHEVKIPQLTTGHETRMKVLGAPDSTQKEAWQNQDKIKLPTDFSQDYGRSYVKPSYPKSISSKRVGINYKEDGGDKADGVLYVRPGVKDVDLGGVNYAQVRVLVDKTHYIKGMAVYKDNLPEGHDIVFNTSKSNTGKKHDALKPITDDPDLPFGSMISRQIVGKGKDPKPTSAMNIVNDDEDWEKWTRTLSSQMLSKQDPRFAKSQLDMTYGHRLTDYEHIKSLTNLTVRKKMLNDFADGTDSAAVHLKAAAMPGQAVKVILPLSSIKPTEVYAPKGFKNGDQVVLIRFPHGGKFEIPELTVNNRNAEGKKFLGDADHAIGIHHEVAKRLSGADFDGDTVLVIPNHRGSILHEPTLAGLKNFDPIAAYPGHPGMKKMTKENTQNQMGRISNLITDMTIKGASNEELSRAIKHSMVVIDAEKHGLDYKRSANDNNIKDLKAKYQRQPDGKGGASTLISLKKQDARIPERKERPQKLGGPVDPKTGEKRYIETNRPNWRTGEPATTKVPLLSITTNAHELSSGTPIEMHYANHSNQLKALANQARLDAIKTPRAKTNSSAKKTYEAEVKSLNNKLDIAKSNAPLERQAQIAANSVVRLKKAENPDMDSKTYKKISAQALNDKRALLKANKQDIEIEPNEWDAIQAGAISDSKLTSILTHADMKKVRMYASPKPEILMTPAVTQRALQMLEQGYTRQEVADHLGVSTTTLDVGTEGKKGD